jgi:hypothetical protein
MLENVMSVPNNVIENINHANALTERKSDNINNECDNHHQDNK